MTNFNSGFNSISPETKEKIVKSITEDNIFEIGHRSLEFKEIVNSLAESFRDYLNVPNNYHILFFQGGSSLQFHTINQFGKGAYITTGYWGNKVFKHAKDGIEIWNNDSVPDVSDLKIPSDIEFIHYCSNETVSGLQFPEYQKFNKPVIVDCSSDLLTREINWNNVDMVYAHSQKNVGTVGVTVVIIKDDLLQTEPDNIPDILSYKVNLKHNSIYNTAPVFNLNVTLIAMKDLIEKFTNISNIKDKYVDFSNKVYDCIDNSQLFYNDIKNRSKSTITFFVNPELGLSEEKVHSYLLKSNMTGVKGHRSIGGFRLSITPALLNDDTLDLIIKTLSVETII